jgi:signal transduction histidine kinase
MRRFTNKQYALFLLFAAITYQGCGWITHYNISPGETFWARTPLAVIGLIFATSLYLKDWPYKVVRLFINTIIFIGTAQYLYLSQVNFMNYWFAVGLFSVVAAASIILTQRWMIICYHLMVNVWVTYISLFLEGFEDYKLLLFNLYAFSIIMLVFEIEKLNLFDRLAGALSQLKLSKSSLQQNYNRNLQAAHDLASPISAINAVADKLKYENPTLYRMLDNSVARINEISGDLLREHRSGKSMIESDFFDLENEISRLVEDKRKEFHSETHLFIFYRFTAPLLEEVHIPRSDFRRVISNLINNSVEAMREKTEKRIKIVIAPNPKSVEVLISDNGHGIPSEQQRDIFEEGVSYKEEGTGLGLSHAKRTIESWGGFLELRSSSGAGTCFKITIPYAQEPQKEESSQLNDLATSS